MLDVFAVLKQQQQHAFKSATFFSARLAVASTTFVPKYRTWRLYLPAAVDFWGHPVRLVLLRVLH